MRSTASLQRIFWIMLFLQQSTSMTGFRIASTSFRRICRTIQFSSNNSDAPVQDGDDADDAAAKALEEYQNNNNKQDQVFSAISMNGQIKVTVATIRNLVNDMIIRHELTKVPSDAMGRLTSCALLVSHGMQKEQMCQISINGDGPLRGAMVIATGDAKVRGYVGSPRIGSMPIGEAVGFGSVQVVKNHPEWPNPYNGITAIRDGTIDRDVGDYLAESEQRSCALAAGTSIEGLLCRAAGGYLVEQLPGIEPETIGKVEENLGLLVKQDGGDKLPTNLLLKGVSPVEIASTLLDGLGMQPLQQIEPEFVCQCSADRLFRSLRLLPREEVDDILAKEEEISARCQFCGKVYRMGPEEVARRYAEATGDPARDPID